MAFFDSILYSVPLSLSTVFFRLILSTLLSGIIGFERGFRGRAAGLRTHILVGIGSTLVVMTGIYGVETLGYAADPMRMAAQVISGIGFLGAGTILVRGKTMVTGLTTAAGLWATAAIGIAVGIGFYPAAVICAVISLFTFICLTTFERGGTYGKYNIRIYVECTDPTALNALLETLSSQEFGLREFEIMPARTGLPNHIGIVAMVIIHRKSEKKERLSKIMEHPSVFIAIESV
ncbi:MAG: MgtC/SapB family protein [Clostridia bacterium]|nr:MgtC/SapB family protein [Clostridia bacterium]